MCGIVGLFLKTDRYRPELGRLTAAMLHEMRSRGPIKSQCGSSYIFAPLASELPCPRKRSTASAGKK